VRIKIDVNIPDKYTAIVFLNGELQFPTMYEIRHLPMYQGSEIEFPYMLDMPRSTLQVYVNNNLYSFVVKDGEVVKGYSGDERVSKDKIEYEKAIKNAEITPLDDDVIEALTPRGCSNNE
jgi:hypothetical protein